MPIRSKDLHGFVPDSSDAALLLIDVINDFEFEGGEALLDLALPVGKNIARLKKTAKEAVEKSSHILGRTAQKEKPSSNSYCPTKMIISY